MAVARLRVTPEVMRTQAETVSKEIMSMEEEFGNLERVVSKTSYYWIGEAGDTHRRLYEEQKDDISLMLRKLKEHPKDLLQMAGVYAATEKRNEEVAVKLPDDVIS